MDDIAIVGMECRFPKAQNIEQFWEILKSGLDAISSLDSERYGFNEVSDNLKRGGFIEGYDQFDSQFFGISKRESQAMDPQQKIMLDVTLRALENAGIDPKNLATTKTGVFIGVMGSEWGRISLSDQNNIEVYSGTGNGYCMIANRISYQYNLRGPSLAIDTACSSSLVAVDVATRYLTTNEIDTALVGGVNLMLTPVLNIFYQKSALASQDGRCKPFGNLADGIVRGEGAGLIVLKRLSDAIKDGTRIYAVIKSTAVNQDGMSNGITAPNRWAQIDVIKSALEKGNMNPADIQYVEAHGTGTLMGDPIEANALNESISRHKTDPLFIGSVKGNLGHLEGAAGIAGIIKTALSIYHKQIPPSLHFGSGNSLIDFQKSNLCVQTNLEKWKNEPRIAGVSSFGLGGTNAHIILESYIATDFLSLDVINIASQISEIPIEKINIHSRLIYELGLDSLMIIDFKNQLEIKFELEGKLELKNIVDLKTIGECIDHIKKILNLRAKQ